MKFLICDKGSEAANEAGRFGSGLAQLAGAEAVHFRVGGGDPVERILAESARGGFDLIVIGSRGGRGLAKRFMGSPVYPGMFSLSRALDRPGGTGI